MKKKLEVPNIDEDVEMVDAYVDEMKEKLGDDFARVSETVMGIKTTVGQIQDKTNTLAEDAKGIDEYNKELLETNGSLVKNYGATLNKKLDTIIEGKEKTEPIYDNPIKTYAELATKKK